MHKILYMLIALAIATNAYSQNPVIGKVKDAETNLPIAGVTLYFPQLEKGTSSNLDGEFEFKNIPDGNFNLIITSIGYSSKTLNLTIPISQNLEILLQASAIEIGALPLIIVAKASSSSARSTAVYAAALITALGAYL